MIRTLWRITPPSTKPLAARYTALLAAAVVARATTIVLLVPVLGHLFGDDPGSAAPWVALFVAAAAVHALLQYRLGRVGFELGLGVMGHAQQLLAERLVVMPIGWPTGVRRASTQRLLASTTTEIAGAIGNLLTPLVQAVALPAAIAIGLLFVAWPLGLVALAAVPLLIGAWWGANRCSRRADAEFAASITDLDDRILEFARVQRALRAARRSDPDRATVGAALDEQHAATVSLLRWSIPGQVLFSVASQLALIGLAVVALWLLRRGDVTVPQALGLLVVVVRFLDPFTTLGELAPALQSTATTLRGFDEILDAPILSTDGPSLSPPADSPPEVRFVDVSFRYPGASATTIDGVDFVAPAGATTAIVGPSGAGKSTLLALVARFHDVDRGEIRIGANDVRHLDPDWLHEQLSFVFQNVHLLDGSIADNVRLGRVGATADDLATVAALAHVDEIVERLPAGWNTPVGEAGVALSGGERQRVGIARALLKQAPLLLVDEATSSLDPQAEHAVAAALDATAGSRTTIIVAHRMRTIEHADHIVFVDDGRVVEAGPREQLLAAGGRFAEFHRQRTATQSWTVGAHD